MQGLGEADFYGNGYKLSEKRLLIVKVAAQFWRPLLALSFTHIYDVMKGRLGLENICILKSKRRVRKTVKRKMGFMWFFIEMLSFFWMLHSGKIFLRK